jgi:hypothetical protein
MSNFLTRLVDRTLGLSEVVQPSIVPIFAGEVTIGGVSSMPPSLAEKNSGLEENRESSQLPGTEAPLSRTDFLSIHPELNKTTIPEKPVPSGRIAGNRTDSKSSVVTEEGKQLNAIPFLPKKEVERKLSPKLRKPESRDSLPTEREMKEVISARIETSPNIALSEKPDLGAVKPDSKKKMKSELALKSKKLPSRDSSSPDRKTNSVASEEMKTPEDVAFPVKPDLGAVKPDSKKKMKWELALKSKKLPSQDSSSPGGKTNSVASEEMKTPEDVALPVKPDLGAVKSYNAEVSSMYSMESPSIVKRSQDTDKEAPSLTSLAFDRVIPAEVYVKQEQTGPSMVDHHSEERDVFSALPDIKVTIGRIDVRAVKQRAPSPSRRQKVAPPPKLSLDDYLKERNRGDR